MGRLALDSGSANPPLFSLLCDSHYKPQKEWTGSTKNHMLGFL